jgi:hypothetical protein
VIDAGDGLNRVNVGRAYQNSDGCCVRGANAEVAPGGDGVRALVDTAGVRACDSVAAGGGSYRD